MKLETFKSAIRPGLTLWALCMLTLHIMSIYKLDGIAYALVAAAIGQWIPDRAISRVKTAIGKQ